jgi:peptidyl-prolyl cis-trans isomerase D
LPLAEVTPAVRERVVAARAYELAKKEGADKLAAWKAAPDSAAMPAPVEVSRVQAQNVPPAMLKAILRAETKALPHFVGVDLGPQGYAVVRINKVTARPEPTEAAAKQDRSQYSQWWSGAEGQAYFAVLKERFKVEMRTPKPASSLPELAAAAMQ